MKTKRIASSFLAFVLMICVMVAFTPVDAYAATAPSKTSISDVTAKDYGFKVTWNKKTNVSGYQIQYSKYSSFSSSKKVTVKGKTTTTKRIRNCKKNTKYYVRVRTYKVVDGKKKYSAWSAKKSIVTKKSPIKTYATGTWKAYKAKINGEFYTMDDLNMTNKVKLTSGGKMYMYTNGDDDGSANWKVISSTKIKWSDSSTSHTGTIMSTGQMKLIINKDMAIYYKKI